MTLGSFRPSGICRLAAACALVALLANCGPADGRSREDSPPEPRAELDGPDVADPNPRSVASAGCSNDSQGPNCITVDWFRYDLFDSETPSGGALWGSSSRNVWLAPAFPTSAPPNNEPYILHYDGNHWRQVPLPYTLREEGKYWYGFRHVWGVSADDAWACMRSTNAHLAYFGPTLRFDGKDWSLDPNPPPSSGCIVAGSSRDDLWSISWNTVAHWDGEVWTEFEHKWEVTGLVALSPKDVWITRNEYYDIWDYEWHVIIETQIYGYIEHWDGNQWSVTKLPLEQTEALGIIGFATNDLWIAGSGGSLLHYDGTVWEPVASGTKHSLRHFWGSGPADIWVAGDNGTLLHYDGIGWTQHAIGSQKNLTAIWGTGAGDVLTVDEAGVVFRVRP